MTKDEALWQALDALEIYGAQAPAVRQTIIAIKEALAQPPEPRNFCPRCGKRTADLTVIHTCTPSRGLEMT